jgi:hypothetical protein
VATVDGFRGIERILPTLVPDTQKSLPESSHLPAPGNKVRVYLADYLAKYSNVPENELSFLKPQLLDVGITAPWYYRRCLKQLKKRFEVLSQASQDPDELAFAGFLETLWADSELFSDYFLCLQKV